MSSKNTPNTEKGNLESSTGEMKPPKQPLSERRITDLNPTSPLLFDSVFESNFGLAGALIDENRGLHYVSAIHSNNTVLHAAVVNDAPISVIKALVEKGLDVNKRNDMGRSPMYLAARHNCRTATVKFLIESGGKLNVTDNYQYTPLMSASYNGASTELIRILVEAGADMFAKDAMGNQAIYWAKQGYHPEIIEYLEQAMARDRVSSEATSQNAESPKIDEDAKTATPGAKTPETVSKRTKLTEASPESAPGSRTQETPDKKEHIL